MPNINGALVASGTGHSIAGAGGRKSVRLENGWVVGSSYNTSEGRFYFYVDRQDNNGFVLGGTRVATVSNTGAWSLASKGNRVYVIFSANTTIAYDTFLATSMNGGTIDTLPGSFYQSFDNGQSSMGTNSVEISGNEIHATWASKNSTYPNSFNIRYAKGTINADGSVTWGAVEQVTIMNSSTNQNYFAPSITIVNNVPLIAVETSGFIMSGSGSINSTSLAKAILVLKRDKTLNSFTYVHADWSYKYIVSNVDNHAHSAPVSLFVPQSINGLANGRLWVAWHGRDATDTNFNNVRISHSDDGGVTWATPTKLTVGNTFHQQNPTITADKNNNIFVIYENHKLGTDIDLEWIQRASNGIWGTTNIYVNSGSPEITPQTFVDFRIKITVPPAFYMDTTVGVRYRANYDEGATVTPASGSLGNKSSSALTAYTVTPEAGTTITSIVERVNGNVTNTFNNPASLSRTFTVPNATWTPLKYFHVHTTSVTVTQSNGFVTVIEYTFTKTLANTASVIEATQANKDAKDRNIAKRNALATQVGLQAGATFDAISAQLASGVFKKFATGTVPSVNGSAFLVSGLSFAPTHFIAYTTNDTSIGFSAGVKNPATGVYRYGSNSAIVAHNFYDDGFSARIDSLTGGHAGYTWIAFG